jgi:3-oxoacyl-[acyl-carrier protein] reductase
MRTAPIGTCSSVATHSVDTPPRVLCLIALTAAANGRTTSGHLSPAGTSLGAVNVTLFSLTCRAAIRHGARVPTAAMTLWPTGSLGWRSVPFGSGLPPLSWFSLMLRSEHRATVSASGDKTCPVMELASGESSMTDLKGKVAVVTGASKGIGAAIAKRFSEAGASVVVNYSSSKKDADQVVADIKANGGKAIAIKGDVAKAADVERLFAETEKVFNRLDVLVNNAGVYKFAPLAETSEAEFHRQFNINVLGTILATKEAVKHFGAKGGSIINLSSVASAGIADAAVYSGTKGAVDAITHALAAELGPRKIRVNAIAPGGVETEGTHEAGVIGSEFEKQMIGGTPLGRIGQPDDIAHVAVFLASDDSAWVTGERLTASGGLR